MTTIIMSTREYLSWLRALQPRMRQAVRRGVLSGAMRAIPIVQRSTDTAPPASPKGKMGAMNTGNYRRNWRAEAIPEGARLYNNTPYEPVIEEGRRAKGVGKEGLRNLELWVRRKLKVRGNEARHVAFAIARTLARRPLAARSVMGRAKDAIVDAVMAEVNREIDKELDK